MCCREPTRRPPSPAAPRRRRHRPRDRGPGLRGVRGASRPTAVCIDLEDVLLAAVGLLDGPAGRRRGSSRAVPRTSSSTSTRTSRRCSSSCSTCGSASVTTSASSATRRRPSTPSPAPDPTTCVGFAAALPGRDAWSGWCATTGRLRRSSPWRTRVLVTRHWCPLLGAGVELRAQRPDWPGHRFAEHADEVAEAGWAAAEIARLVAAGTPAREIAVLYRVNAQSEAYEQALAEAGVPYVVRGGRALLRPGRGAAGGDAVARRGPVRRLRRRRPGRRGGDGGGARVGAGWSSRAAVRRRRRSRAMGVAGRSWSRSPRKSSPRSRRPGSPSCWPSSKDGPRRSTHPSPTASRWPRCMRPRGWSGMPSSWSAATRAPCRLAYAETTAQLEEERRLLYVGVTRARQWLRVSWSLARGRPAAVDRVDPAASSTASGRPESPAPTPRAAVSPEHGARAPEVRQRCRVCGAALSAAADRKIGRCADCPSSVDEALFDRLRAWRLERAQEQKRPGLRRVHRRHPYRDRRDQTGRRARSGGGPRGRPDQTRPLRIRRSGALPESESINALLLTGSRSSLSC